MNESRLFIKDIGGLDKKISSYEYILSSINSNYLMSFTKEDFSFGENGKPYLDAFSHSFNLSHSEDLIALIVSDNKADVGIDIQVVRDRYSTEKIAERAFSESERAWMSDKEDGFFRLWSMKEALIKAHGGSIWDAKRYGDVTSRLSDFDSFFIIHKEKRYYLSIYPSQGEISIPSEFSITRLL